MSVLNKFWVVRLFIWIDEINFRLSDHLFRQVSLSYYVSKLLLNCCIILLKCEKFDRGAVESGTHVTWPASHSPFPHVYIYIYKGPMKNYAWPNQNQTVPSLSISLSFSPWKRNSWGECCLVRDHFWEAQRGASFKRSRTRLHSPQLINNSAHMQQ